MTARTAIVTDGEHRAALAIVRSLGGAGYRCVVASPRRRSIAGASRYAASEHTVPVAMSDPDAYVDAVAALVHAERATLLFPVSEAALLALLPHRTRLVPCVVPFADAETFRALSDKQRVLQEAAALGIETPAQVVVPAAGAAVDTAALSYPIVLKPARTIGEASGRREQLSVAYAADRETLAARLAALPEAAYPLLLQQRVSGEGVGVFLLLWDGAVRAVFAHRRLAEKPPAGGVSVHCESIALDPLLYEQSCALLGKFGWRGVAMVEYKRDRATGRAYLMEINGRFWGSLQLAIDAGVDFPRLLAELATDGAAMTPPPYAVGVRSRWMWGQVDHLLARLRRRGMNRALPPGTVSFSRALVDFAAGPFRRGDRDSVFRWADPRPFWRESLQWWSLR